MAMIDTTARSDRLLWVSTVARVLLGATMLYAGIIKLTEPGQALRAVQAYRILPPSIDDIVAYGLPLLEMAVGALLLLGLSTKTAAWVTGGLMVVFVAGVASAWIRGLSIDCGCSGFQYGFDLETKQEPDDLVITKNGAVVLIDPVSLPYMEGSVIDFVDDFIGQAFKIDNPNATASCGCGTSFSI